MRNLLLAAAALAVLSAPVRASERDERTTPPQVSFISFDHIGVAAAYSRVSDVRSAVVVGGTVLTDAELALLSGPSSYRAGETGIVESSGGRFVRIHRFEDPLTNALYLVLLHGGPHGQPVKPVAPRDFADRAAALRRRIAAIELQRTAAGIIGDATPGGGCEKNEDQYDLAGTRATLAGLSAAAISHPSEIARLHVAYERLAAYLR